MDLGKETYTLPIYGCKFCGYEGMLHRHGYYSRNVITKHYIRRIDILRVKCPSCGKTHAVLPSFLIPYYQYSLEFIFECLYMSYVILNYYLKGLTKDETKEYVKSRLKSYGCHEPIFTDSAYELLYSSTNGSIRTLNSLVRLCLILGANEKLKSIDNEIVFSSLNELNIVAYLKVLEYL